MAAKPPADFSNSQKKKPAAVRKCTACCELAGAAVVASPAPLPGARKPAAADEPDQSLVAKPHSAAADAAAAAADAAAAAAAPFSGVLGALRNAGVDFSFSTRVLEPGEEVNPPPPGTVKSGNPKTFTQQSGRGQVS